jgi:hypothetical protein
MNREVHVRFWESAGLRCPAPLNNQHAFETGSELRAGLTWWINYYTELPAIFARKLLRGCANSAEFAPAVAM